MTLHELGICSFDWYEIVDYDHLYSYYEYDKHALETGHRSKKYFDVIYTLHSR